MAGAVPAVHSLRDEEKANKMRGASAPNSARPTRMKKTRRRN